MHHFEHQYTRNPLIVSCGNNFRLSFEQTRSCNCFNRFESAVCQQICALNSSDRDDTVFLSCLAAWSVEPWACKMVWANEICRLVALIEWLQPITNDTTATFRGIKMLVDKFDWPWTKLSPFSICWWVSRINFLQTRLRAKRYFAI